MADSARREQTPKACFPAELQRLTDEYVRNEGLEWPTRSTDADGLDEDPKQMFSALGFAPEAIEMFADFSLADFIEKDLVATLLAGLPGPLADVLRNCVAVRATGVKSPHADVHDRQPFGIMVLMNGGLPGAIFTLLGHSFSRTHYARIDSGRTGVTVEPPTSEQLLAAAAHLYAWLHPSGEFDWSDFPAIAPTSGTSFSVFAKTLRFVELFCLAHEYAHALEILGLLPDVSLWYNQYFDFEDFPPEVRPGWERELNADRVGLLLVTMAYEDTPGASDVAAAGCLIAIDVLDVLDLVIGVPFAAHTSPRMHSAGLPPLEDHPPTDLRRHLLTEMVREHHPEGLRLLKDFHLTTSLRWLVQGMDANSGHSCIAPSNISGAHQSFCGQPRAAHGWYCPEHV
ncbi:MAG: hypothetical protein JWO67_3275 [Streptosporangiaceae bacterium]|nr:hypothetical protein [Streptosporangiaceae bacterium]